MAKLPENISVNVQVKALWSRCLAKSNWSNNSSRMQLHSEGSYLRGINFTKNLPVPYSYALVFDEPSVRSTTLGLKHMPRTGSRGSAPRPLGLTVGGRSDHAFGEATPCIKDCVLVEGQAD
jgi:hypothetical protein